MHKITSQKVIVGTLFNIILFSTLACADEVKILAAEFTTTGNNIWSVSVTLQHGDTGWKHYADNWRIVDTSGTLLGDRVLYHPHVDEQPFTRSLQNVKIQPDISTVYIEAHDKVHGWTPNRLKVDLRDATDGRLSVEQK